MRGLLLLLPRKDAEAEEYREKVLEENSHFEEDLFSRLLFFRLILLKFGRRRRVDIDRSINLWQKSEEKIEELFYALAFRFAVSFFDI